MKNFPFENNFNDIKLWIKVISIIEIEIWIFIEFQLEGNLDKNSQMSFHQL